MGRLLHVCAAGTHCSPCTCLLACRGLYDPALGPVEQGSALCPTCHLTAKECPGHMGHIELDVPVYHPLLFPTLFLLMRHKCLACHRWMGAPPPRVGCLPLCFFCFCVCCT